MTRKTARIENCFWFDFNQYLQMLRDTSVCKVTLSHIDSETANKQSKSYGIAHHQYYHLQRSLHLKIVVAFDSLTRVMVLWNYFLVPAIDQTYCKSCLISLIDGSFGRKYFQNVFHCGAPLNMALKSAQNGPSPLAFLLLGSLNS